EQLAVPRLLGSEFVHRLPAACRNEAVPQLLLLQRLADRGSNLVQELREIAARHRQAATTDETVTAAASRLERGPATTLPTGLRNGGVRAKRAATDRLGAEGDRARITNSHYHAPPELLPLLNQPRPEVVVEKLS